MSIAQNLVGVKARIKSAAERVGRNPETITLVGVTKSVTTKEILELAACGQVIIGESRPQVIRDRMEELKDHRELKWHMIGSLQSNKIKYLYQNVELVHSLDRPELIEHFAEWFRKTGRKCPCLLEVHISEEESKRGFSPDRLSDFIRSIKDRQDVLICGMMGMAPFVEDRTVVRQSFKKLAMLFSASREIQGSGYQATHLSMGMSDDFELAIEEGSTMVRIGHALFE